MSNQDKAPAGVLALFDDVDSLLDACRRMRDAGYTRWEAHAPFPVHGLDKAAGIKPTVLPWIVLVCGLTGTGCAMLMQWWMNAHDYKYLISGKPFFSVPANVPVAFEMTILFASFAAFFGMLALNRFPRWSNPLFRMPEFRRVTADRFAIVVDPADPKFHAGAAFLGEIGAKQVLPVPADPSPAKFPVWVHMVGSLVTMAALIPVALIIRAHYVTSPNPPIHVVPDMDFQWKDKAQTSNPTFADGRAMRKAVAGTVSVDADVDPNLLSYQSGKSTMVDATGTTYRTDFPLPVTKELLALGEMKFGVYCAPCHGGSGYGDGPVHQRAMALETAGWIPPVNFHAETSLALSTGRLYDSIVNGVRGNMQSYASQLPTAEERWAVVAFIRALQRSQNASTSDLPQGMQPKEIK
ncbi:MAG: DUF3341 domain-containing protein [Planctomycetes bacterium]|nr:DUF3341 domain-containing protein [Planctomycetota bacterium]MCB9910580.1 DUF3341 domain-containing protein [Planctomycetota bacterium]MCB9913205.1 DUF3341 domain-containing protein [Planctomycetota bacterium]HPF15685.1 DUF3341 domain-containing protein [Planctomycetota bacterium]